MSEAPDMLTTDEAYQALCRELEAMTDAGPGSTSNEVAGALEDMIEAHIAKFAKSFDEVLAARIEKARTLLAAKDVHV